MIVYADNNATTAIAPEVVEAMRPYFTAEYFNPSSMYDSSKPAADAITAARQTVAKLLGVGASRQILFTSCATESNNAAIFGVTKAMPTRRHVITSAVEHPAVLEVCKELARNDYEVTVLPVDRHGQIDMADFVRALRPEQTALVTIMHANNETGVVFPIEEMSRLTKETEPDIVFHTDATQTVGKIPIDLKNGMPHVDLLSFSGHKMHAPKGIGALFIRRGTPIRPYMIGGHQEEGRRAGTENVPYIVGLAKACELAQEHMPEEARVLALRDRVEKGLIDAIPHLEINGSGAIRLPNTLNVAVHYVEGEGMLYQLSASGVCASSGSACTSGSLEPSHVLMAMKVPFTAMHGSIRFSLSRYSTDADIERILEVFPGIVANLRRLSPYWDVKTNAPRRNADSQIGM
ncbi:MAG: cysteine desulfurase NifS [Deltaproteobacteria bacterium RIFOXYA12_FULL_58_15]|nr:MAG: cysteine desulfurase NifS [Deltaproteobacteria bacterium RIFOXYA12_FULL_58_15]OGR14742.1 MAG: cysteine desulfurase NifS [Deltaproteobacteria bacterium RIFOXYB12_FULL_58_9]